MNFLLITYALKFILFYFKEKKNDGFFSRRRKNQFYSKNLHQNLNLESASPLVLIYNYLSYKPVEDYRHKMRLLSIERRDDFLLNPRGHTRQKLECFHILCLSNEPKFRQGNWIEMCFATQAFSMDSFTVNSIEWMKWIIRNQCGTVVWKQINNFLISGLVQKVDVSPEVGNIWARNQQGDPSMSHLVWRSPDVLPLPDHSRGRQHGCWRSHICLSR